MIKKVLTAVSEIPDEIYNKIVFRYRKIQAEDKVVIHGKLRVFGHGRISIGKNVTINSCLSSNPIGGDTKTIFSLKNTAELIIGDRVGISNSALVCHQRISIGNGTIIGGGTKIYDTDFHTLDEKERGDYQHEVAVTKPVSIGENVFIGAHCIILKGVNIGDRSIVGAGSVVAKDIPADQVWAGNPARRIR